MPDLGLPASRTGTGNVSSLAPALQDLLQLPSADKDRSTEQNSRAQVLSAGSLSRWLDTPPTSVATNLKTMALPLTRVFCSGVLPWSLSPAFPKLSHPLCALYVDIRGTKGEEGEVPCCQGGPVGGTQPPHIRRTWPSASATPSTGDTSPLNKGKRSGRSRATVLSSFQLSLFRSQLRPHILGCSAQQGQQINQEKRKIVTGRFFDQSLVRNCSLDKQFACTNLATIYLFKL